MGTPGVHLVGSIPLADAGEVFETVSDILGEFICRIPDGETRERSNWIAWQLKLLEQNEQMEIDPAIAPPGHAAADDGLAVDSRKFRFLRVKPGISANELSLRTAYAETALRSYDSFKSLQANGKIPPTTRMQVTLPTPYAVASLYVAPESWPVFLPAYEHAILQELLHIVQTIPKDSLAIQGFIFSMLGRLCDAVPGGIDVGIHLCYGDPGHKHIVEPKDASILTILANGICSGTTRKINWIHMPVPRERDDSEYFAPLQNLKLDAGCELYLGLIHFTDKDDGANKRMRAARQFVEDFGLSTECGLGRRPIETIVPLLELHKRCACSNTDPSV